MRASLLVFAGEHAASGEDVLATAATDGADYATRIEIVAEANHTLLVRGLEVDARNGVEADEIDANRLAIDELLKRLCMFHVVVEAVEHDVFERQTALVSEIVIAEHTHHLIDRIGVFYRHKICALGMIWRVYAYGDMHVGLLYELGELSDFTD